MPKYIDAGMMLLPDADTSSIPEGNLRYVAKCDSCGALVNNGGLSREKHDAFHEALADLFEKFEEKLASTNWPEVN